MLTDETPGADTTCSEETMPDNTPSTAADSDTKTPAQVVQELQADLKAQDKNVSERTKERDALKTDVDALAKNPAEIDKAKADAAKSLPQIIKDREEFTKGRDDTLKGTEAILGPTKTELVKAKIKAVKDKIDEQKKTVEEARKNVSKTEVTAREAQDKLDKAQKSYDDLKGFEKDSFKLLGDLKSKIDKLNDVGKPATIYVLLAEMNEPLKAVNAIPETADKFEAELINRWNALVKAKKESRDAKLAFEIAKTDLATAESTLAALEKSRVDDMIAATEEFNNRVSVP